MNANDFKQGINQIAKQYQEEGYSVTIRPESDQVPPFLVELQPDLIAIRGEEHVVVQIRPTRAELATDPQTTKIAELTNRQPGWRFDLVVLGPENPLSRVTEQAQEPTEAQFRGMIRKARTALEAGLTEMALIFAWAVLEGAMRRIREDGELHGRTTSRELLSMLYSNGILTPEEFRRMKECWKLRTEAVHGFATPPIDPMLVEDVLAVVDKLVENEEPAVA